MDAGIVALLYWQWWKFPRRRLDIVLWLQRRTEAVVVVLGRRILHGRVLNNHNGAVVVLIHGRELDVH